MSLGQEIKTQNCHLKGRVSGRLNQFSKSRSFIQYSTSTYRVVSLWASAVPGMGTVVMNVTDRFLTSWNLYSNGRSQVIKMKNSKIILGNKSCKNNNREMGWRATGNVSSDKISLTRGHCQEVLRSFA